MGDASHPARRYARIRYRLIWLDMALSWAFLAWFQASGQSSNLALWASRHAAHPAGELALYLAVFGPLGYCVALPLHVYRSYFLEHRFGLSRLSAGGWLIRELKRASLAAAFGFVLTQGLFVLLRRSPDFWPVWATLSWVLISVVLARVLPTVLIPVFYKTVPLDNADLAGRLNRLCGRAGVKTLGVFRIDLGAETRKANAALVGLGRTRRVLLSDTLIAHFPPDEIEGVLAHELAHHHYRHIVKGLIVSSIGSFVVFWLTSRLADRAAVFLGLVGLADPAGLPALSLWLGALSFLSLPVQNGISRAFEWQADRFAVRMSASPKVFASALRRLGELNLSDPNPPAWIEWLFYDHPATFRRVAAAEKAAS